MGGGIDDNLEYGVSGGWVFFGDDMFYSVFVIDVAMMFLKYTI